MQWPQLFVTLSKKAKRLYSLSQLILLYTQQILPLLKSLHGWRDSNSQPMVLETTTLPIELQSQLKQ